MTARRYFDHQLNLQFNLQYKRCCVLCHMKAVRGDVCDNNKDIPSLIHRVWVDEHVPEKWNRTYISCDREGYAEHYDKMLWTDAKARRFLEEKFPWFIPTYLVRSTPMLLLNVFRYDSYPHTIQRADAVRYFILYEYGGIYMDLDVGCRRNLDPLRVYNLILPKTNPIGFSNDMMLSAKGHPFWKQVIHELPKWNHNYFIKYLTVFLSTGPLFISYQWNTFANKTNLTRVLPEKLYGNRKTSFFFHVAGSSWHGKDAKVITYIYEHPSQVMVRVGLALGLIIGAVLLWKRFRRRRRI